MADRKLAREVLEGLETMPSTSGKPTRGRVTVVRVPDAVNVRRIRVALHLTQDEFAPALCPSADDRS